MNQPPGQRPLHMPRPLMVFGAGILVLAFLGRFSLEGTEFAFGSAVKPSIDQLVEPSYELPDWGVVLVPKGEFRFFRVEGPSHDPNQSLSFLNMRASLIGRVEPIDPSWDQWPKDPEENSVSGRKDALWVSEKDRSTETFFYVGKYDIGELSLLFTIHELGKESQRTDDKPSVFDELLDCFEPL